MENKDLTILIARDFQLEATQEPLTEDEVLAWLADHIAYLIEYRLEFLMSLMYRLDVPESQVNQAISPINPEPANIALARIVLARQKQRIFTKHAYKSDDLTDFTDDWKW